MFTYYEGNAEASHTPWGRAVKNKLVEKEMLQKELIAILNQKGFGTNPSKFAALLRGRGARKQTALIHEVNIILGIPEIE